MTLKRPAAVFIFFLSAIISLSGFRPGLALKVDTKKVSSGNTYTLFYKDNLKMDVALKRPDKNDVNIQLCIPGAYTLLTDYTVDGLYIDNGTTHNRNAINYTLGGGIKIVNGNCEIFPTQKGKLLDANFIAAAEKEKASFFQQIQMVEKGVGATYKDKKLFQRRAIVKLKGGKTAVIESYQFITLTAFTKDLIELGAVDALYTDMGAWDEGWYRTEDGKTKTIGRLRTQTDKQCNWVVFKIK
ncbi:MAG: hypothetical protein ACJ77K_05730 [Bacteroidia bacterium]